MTKQPETFEEIVHGASPGCDVKIGRARTCMNRSVVAASVRHAKGHCEPWVRLMCATHGRQAFQEACIQLEIYARHDSEHCGDCGGTVRRVSDLLTIEEL